MDTRPAHESRLGETVSFAQDWAEEPTQDLQQARVGSKPKGLFRAVISNTSTSTARALGEPLPVVVGRHRTDASAEEQSASGVASRRSSLSCRVSMSLSPLGFRKSRSTTPQSRASMIRPRIGDLSISPRVLRGVPIKHALSWCGSLWRSSPCDMAKEDLLSLYDLSVPCEELDAFISHAWTCPWWQRFLALLIHLYWKPAAASALFTAGLFFALDVAGALPTWYKGVPDGFAWDIHFRYGLDYSPWSGLPPIVGIIVLFICPLLDHRKGYSRIFFDLVCINQIDESLKAEGISHLGGFLERSRELIVLWAPTNLSRAWCVFELAVFHVLEGDRKITWCPLFLYVYLFLTYASLSTGLWFFEVIRLIPESDAPAPFPVWKALVSNTNNVVNCCLASILVHYGRKSMQERHEFTETIEHFDISSANCRMDADKEYIVKSIRHWYGNEDAFNDYVRIDLAQQVFAELAWIDQTYIIGIMASFPFTCLGLEWAAGHLRGDLSWEERALGIGSAAIVVYCTVPLSLRLGWFIFTSSRKRCKSRIVDILLTVVAGSIWYLSYYVGVLAQMLVLKRSVSGSIVLAILLVIITVLVFPVCGVGRDVPLAEDPLENDTAQGAGPLNKQAQRQRA